MSPAAAIRKLLSDGELHWASEVKGCTKQEAEDAFELMEIAGEVERIGLRYRLPAERKSRLKASTLTDEERKERRRVKMIEYHKKWYDSNRPLILERKRAVYAADPEKERKRCRAWRAANPEKARAITRKSVDDLRERRGPSYRSYQAMKQRCYDPNTDHFKYYGKRGITVCERWLNSFDAFRQDLGDRPKGLTIDRIDNNGGYWCGRCDDCVSKGRPFNCRWADMKTQAANRNKPVKRQRKAA